MAKLRFQGIDDYVKKLEQVNAHAEGDIKRAVYEGAAVVAGEIKKQIRSLKVTEGGLSQEEKDGLIKGFGLADMRKDGYYINTKAGFAGLSPKKTEKFPLGIPNVTIARQVESGTSKTKKQPFIRLAVARSKAKAEEAMASEINRLIKKHQNGG